VTENNKQEYPDKGFVIIGIDTAEDNVRYCYALACSIKTCDPDSSITLIVDKDKSENVPSYYTDPFDYIVELPFGNSAYSDGFHGMNIWQVYHATPYKETIYLDYDTLFLNVDINDLWKVMGVNDISVPQNATSYRNFPIVGHFRFDFENQYKLPRLFYNMIYWRQDTKSAIEWFKMADPVFQNWRNVYNNTFTDRKPDTFAKNLLGNLITHFVDHTEYIGVQLNNHYDLHNFSHGVFHSLEEMPKHWTDMLNVWVTGARKIQIENSVINNGIIHYSDETFLTDEVIDVFRDSFTERIQKR
tara:strand:+ start:2488 stop:3390 length:903 start_codon:yes stop_codon:yes gene_type:complete